MLQHKAKRKNKNPSAFCPKEKKIRSSDESITKGREKMIQNMMLRMNTQKRKDATKRSTCIRSKGSTTRPIDQKNQIFDVTQDTRQTIAKESSNDNSFSRHHNHQHSHTE